VYTRRSCVFFALGSLVACGAEGPTGPVSAQPADGPAAPPAWATTCGAPSSRFTVLAASCARRDAPGGYWDARPVFRSGERTLCEMTWRGSPDSNALPAYSSLQAIALPEDGAVFSPDSPAVYAVCGTAAICEASVATCVERTATAVDPTLPIPYEGMPGCSSCVFVADETLYAVLPASAITGPVTIDLAGTPITIDPAGEQIFRANVAAFLEASAPRRFFARASF
jgi:hypothetical protein